MNTRNPDFICMKYMHENSPLKVIQFAYSSRLVKKEEKKFCCVKYVTVKLC